ncbi:MAG: hypothetical protein BRC30_01660, partial [Nanohaloarchaea archaeon SW_7_46_7]
MGLEIRLRELVQRAKNLVRSMTDDNTSEQVEEKENQEKEEQRQEGKEDKKKQKVQFPQYFQQQQNRGDKNPNGTNLKTPVLRGVVVSEFDGDRIWVEASGNMKGRYGVEVPNGYDAKEF